MPKKFSDITSPLLRVDRWFTSLLYELVLAAKLCGAIAITLVGCVQFYGSARSPDLDFGDTPEIHSVRVQLSRTAADVISLDLERLFV